MRCQVVPSKSWESHLGHFVKTENVNEFLFEWILCLDLILQIKKPRGLKKKEEVKVSRGFIEIQLLGRMYKGVGVRRWLLSYRCEWS